MAPRKRRISQGKLVESKMRGRLLAAEAHLYSINQMRPHAKVPTINGRCVKIGIVVGTAKANYFNLEATSINTILDVTIMKDHLHDPDSYEILVRETVNEICRRAETEPNTALMRIIQPVTNEISSGEALVRLPERQTLIRRINRAQNRSRSPNPHNLTELQITEVMPESVIVDVFFTGASPYGGKETNKALEQGATQKKK